MLGNFFQNLKGHQQRANKKQQLPTSFK